MAADDSTLQDQKIRDSCIGHLHLARNESARAVLTNPASEQGFILNRHSHWYCIRRIEGQ